MRTLQRNNLNFRRITVVYFFKYLKHYYQWVKYPPSHSEKNQQYVMSFFFFFKVIVLYLHILRTFGMSSGYMVIVLQNQINFLILFIFIFACARPSLLFAGFLQLG